MKDMKFPKKDGLPDGLWTRYKIGTELLALLSASANAVDRKNSHTVKGLMKHFDIIGSFHQQEVRQYKFILELKKKVFGKDFLDECIMCSVELHKKADLDVMKVLGLTNRSLSALEVKN